MNQSMWAREIDGGADDRGTVALSVCDREADALVRRVAALLLSGRKQDC
jgi:hypothetical protein